MPTLRFLTQQVFHTAEYPSQITLPISPNSNWEENNAQ
jgi:hypothetical protein